VSSLPALQDHLGEYAPRGFSTVAESQLWDPKAISADALASFILYAKRVHTTLSMTQLLELVRESSYDLDAAHAALVHPLLSPDTAPRPIELNGDMNEEDPGALEEVRRTLAKMEAHHQLIKTTAARTHRQRVPQLLSSVSVSDDMEEDGPIFIPSNEQISSIKRTNERCEEQAWNESAAKAAEAINAALTALTKVVPSSPATNSQNVPSNVTPSKAAAKANGVKKEPVGRRPGRPPKNTASASPRLSAQASPDDEDVDDKGDEDDAAGAASDVEDGKDIAAMSPAAVSKQSTDPAFLYPWLACPGHGAHIPAPSKIDVLKLRDIVQIVADAAHEAAAGPDAPKLPPMSVNAASWAVALQAGVSEAHIAVLTSLVVAKNEWLDRVRPLLHAVSRAKEHTVITMEQVCESLRELEAQAPCIDSRERRKCVSIVNKVQEWRLMCQGLLKTASIPGHTGALTSPAFSPPPSTTPPVIPTTPPQPLTVISLSRMLKECDRLCGPVATDESIFLRSIIDYVGNFIRQVDSLVSSRVDQEEKEEAASVALAQVNSAAAQLQQRSISPAIASPALVGNSTEDNADMETSVDGDDEPSTVRRRIATRIRGSGANAVGDNSPISGGGNAAAATADLACFNATNDYPQEGGGLPSKLILSQAKLLLSRFHARFALAFSLPHVELLTRQISRAESWMSAASAALRATRRHGPGETDAWVEQLSSLIEGADSLALQVDAPMLDPLKQGLRGRLWIAKVDQAFELADQTTIDTASSANVTAIKEEAKESDAIDAKPIVVRRGPPLQRVYDLLAEALEIPIPSNVTRYQKLEHVLTQAQDAIDRASAMLAPKGVGGVGTKLPLRDWQALLDGIRSLPVHLDEEARIERVLHNTAEWNKKVYTLLTESISTIPTPDGSVPSTPTITASSSTVPPVLAPRSPHSIPFDTLESLMHRVSGKNIALLSDTCPNTEDNSETFTALKILLKVGRAWCQEVSDCFKHLSTTHTNTSAGRGTTKTAATAPASGSNKKGSSNPSGSASSLKDGATETLDRYATMQRLQQLLGLYRCRDAEMEDSDEEDEEDEDEDEKEEEEAEKKAEGEDAKMDTSAADVKSSKKEKQSKVESATPTASIDGTTPAPVSLPSTDPTSWSWLSRYQLDPVLFEQLLPQLELKMADRLADRLALVSHSLALAWSALRGPKRQTISELSQLVHQLQQSGELETVEPLRTCIGRLRLAQSWRSAARKLTPYSYLVEVRRKYKRRRERSTGRTGLDIAHIVREPRRTRKRVGVGSAADADNDSDDDEDQQRANSMEAQLFNFSDDEDGAGGGAPEHDDERAATGEGDEEGSSRRMYTASLAELQHLNILYQRFVDRRAANPSGDGAGVPLPSALGALPAGGAVPPSPSMGRPSTPSNQLTGGTPSSAVLSLGPDELEECSLGLDLVELEELEALQHAIADCTEWQTKAVAVLADPSCAAFAHAVAQAQPMYNQPKLPAHLLTPNGMLSEISRPTTPHNLTSFGFTMPMEGTAVPAVADGTGAAAVVPTADSLSSMRALLSEVDSHDLSIAIPEIERLSHLSWAADWIGQAQTILSKCHRAYARAAMEGGSVVILREDTPVADANLAAATGLAAAEAVITGATVREATSTAAAAAAVTPNILLAPPVPEEDQVSLDALVNLLRSVRSHFGPEQYTPLVFHLELLCAQQHARAEAGILMSGGAEHEMDQDQGEEGDNASAIKAETQVAASHPTIVVPSFHSEASVIDDSAVKMELDDANAAADAGITMDPSTLAVAANVAGGIKVENEQVDTSEMIDTSSSHTGVIAGVNSFSSGVDPFLFQFRFDLQHLEFYLYELLNSAHKLRQLFERRLGSQHTNILLGPPREELLMWVADAAEQAGINAMAPTATNTSGEATSAVPAGTAVATHSETGAPAAAASAESGGYGLLATSRRLKLQRARERARASAVARGIPTSTPQPRDRRHVNEKAGQQLTASPAHEVVPIAAAAVSAARGTGGAAAGGRSRKKSAGVKAEPADDNGLTTTAKGGKRQRKGKLPFGAGVAAAIASFTPAVAAAVPVDVNAAMAMDDAAGMDGGINGGDDGNAGGEDENDQTLYCLCQRPYVEGELMLCCDTCSLWFHTACLALNKADVKKATEQSKFFCPACCRQSRRSYKFRERIPHRRTKARGPKLISLALLLSKMPPALICEEGIRALGIVQRALTWAASAELALRTPPNSTTNQEQIQNHTTVQLNQQQHQAAAIAALAAAEAVPIALAATVTDVPISTAAEAPSMTTDVPSALVTNIAADALPALPTASEGDVAMMDLESVPVRAAPLVAPAAVSVAPAVTAAPVYVPVPPASIPVGSNRRDVEASLALECQQREFALRQHVTYTDELAHVLREGMGLPLELAQRKTLEERIRLLLSLEKAERILLDNVTVPLLPKTAKEEASELEATIAAASAAAEDAEANAAASSAANAVTSTGVGNVLSVQPHAKEREQNSLTPHARRHEIKEIQLVHSELAKARAAAAASSGTLVVDSPEAISAQNGIWNKFDSFVTRLLTWVEKTNNALNQGLSAAAAGAGGADALASNPAAAAAAIVSSSSPITAGATLQTLILLHTEYKNNFLMVLSPTAGDLARRIQNVAKWIPREKKALAKGLRYLSLWKVSGCNLYQTFNVMQIISMCS
jgi:hypothetical protein